MPIASTDLLVGGNAFMSHRLYFLEGLPGSGKTTRAKLLSAAMLRSGKPFVIYHECEKNPLDLARYAILSPSEYAALKQQLEDAFREDPAKAANVLRKLDAMSERFDGNIYVAFRTFYDDEETNRIANVLCFRDVYNGHYPFETFRKLHLNRWRAFAEAERAEETTYICDAILMQSPLFELFGFYDMPEEPMIAYLSELATCVEVLSPEIHYNRVSNIPAFVKDVCEKRKFDKSKWEYGFYKWMEAAPYFQRRKYQGFEGMCAFFEERQAFELKALQKIGFPYEIHVRSIDN